MGIRVLTVAAVLLGWALPLRAQQPVELQFDAGLVTLSAQNVPVRTILAEWARLGGATIVNGDRVVGPPVTIELNGVPEQQALGIILRSVAGYVLAPRGSGSNGASAFDRILILATSAAPRNPPPPAVAASAPRPTLRRPPAVVRPPQAGGGAPVGVGPGGGGNGFNPLGAGGVGLQLPGNPNPVPQPLVTRPPLPAGAEFLNPQNMTGGGLGQGPASPAGVVPTPANPFGIPFGSSATPGVVAPTPQQQQQQQ